MKEWHAVCLAVAVIAVGATIFASVNFAVAQDAPYIRYFDKDGNERKYWQAELILENTVDGTVTRITFQSHPDENPSGVDVVRTHEFAVEVHPIPDLFDIDVSSKLATVTGDQNTIAEYKIVDKVEQYEITKITGDESEEHYTIIIPKDRVLSLAVGDDLF